MKVPMGPPPPRIPNSSTPNANSPPDTQSNPQEEHPQGQSNAHVAESPDIKTPDVSEQPQIKTPQIPVAEQPEIKTPQIPVAEQPEFKIPLNSVAESLEFKGPTDPASESVETKAPENDKPSAVSAAGQSPNVSVPYTIPPWSGPPCHPFALEVLKDGTIIDSFDVSRKGAYMFGRIDLCDFMLEHPTISRFHAVLQFKRSGDAFLYDLGSTHGTFINKNQVKKKVYMELHVGDVIRFGHSSRLYIFQGPSELMPPERDLTKLRNAKILEEMQDREASLLRARAEASLADGISWGMAEDAIDEDTEDAADEVTWQTFKGQLTEKQEKTRAKIIKRTEKVANMKKEIDAIRAKDIAQGGLTQGQQTQIARNEQRISQILEELESLEETLNESIQESIGARAGRTIHGKKKGTVEDEDEVPSDDDEFYDRTKKQPAITKGGKQQQTETADTLLDKKDAIVKEMEVKKESLSKEKAKMVPEIAAGTDSADALDAFMTGLSSELVVNTTEQLEMELSALQSELDRIVYLLKIADPMGEAALRRSSKSQRTTSIEPDLRSQTLKASEPYSKVQTSKSNEPQVSISSIPARLPVEEEKGSVSIKMSNGSSNKEKTPHHAAEAEDDRNAKKHVESKVPTYTITKPTWLGATEDMIRKEDREVQETSSDLHEDSHFVDYKDRKKALAPTGDAKEPVRSVIEDAGPGLIIRKRKQADEPTEHDDKAPGVPTLASADAETSAADAVALLLKHTRGYVAADGEEGDENQQSQIEDESGKRKAKSKRVLGPEKPAFLDTSPEYESWVPPQGQSGDGRTALNDRYGY